MKKAILAILLILCILLPAGFIYINKVFLPLKIKSTLIDSIEKRTGFSVRLEKIRFNIFKGLVLEGFSLYDGETPLLSAREVECSFLIAPLIRRQIVIPSLKINSPVLFVLRRQDKSFNIERLFSPAKEENAKKTFGLLVYRIDINGGTLDFRDDSLEATFQAKIKGLNLSASLPLPSLVKFKASAEIVDAGRLDAAGDFNLLRGEFKATVNAKGLLPGYFSAYYRQSGFYVKDGMLDLSANVRYKNEKADLLIKAASSDIALGADNILLKARVQIDSSLQFDTGAKVLTYFGTADIINGEISGIKETGEIKAVNASIKFDNLGLSGDKILAEFLGFPVTAKITLRDYKNPAIDIEAAADLQLDSTAGLLRERFNISFPAEIKGTGKLLLAVNKPAAQNGALSYSGVLDIINGQLDWEKFKLELRDISGKINFNAAALNWQDLKFTLRGAPYKTSGVLKDYTAPSVNLTLVSPELSLKTTFNIKDKLANIAEFSGEYLKSRIWISGSFDTADAAAPQVHLDVSSKIDLSGLEKFFSGSKPNYAAMKLQGILSLRSRIDGDINDLAACDIEAKIEGPVFSFYGLKGRNLSVEYLQRSGLGEMQEAGFDFYGGKVSAQAKINLNSANFPYRIEAAVDSVSLEKLKADTPLKDKPLAGIVKASGNFSGFWGDISKLGGNGRLFITEGNLWQLNLFQGLGSFVFARDFANIIFNDGSCSFQVKDRHIYSEDIKLKSNITNLAGSADIGFDSSLNAALNVEVLDENVPLTGTFRDVATAIIGSAGRFGVIRISGTLSKPQYTFKAAVGDIIQSLKDAILKNISR